VEESVLSKLPRHEPTLERQLYRALHELEHRQAARRSAALTPPRVLPPAVSGMPEEMGR
jgi:hypothetical protein